MICHWAPNLLAVNTRRDLTFSWADASVLPNQPFVLARRKFAFGLALLSDIQNRDGKPMTMVLELTKLGLLLLWRQTKLFIGRLFWFWIAFEIGGWIFNSDLAAALLAAVVAMATLRVAISDDEIAKSVGRVLRPD